VVGSSEEEFFDLIDAEIEDKLKPLNRKSHLNSERSEKERSVIFRGNLLMIRINQAHSHPSSCLEVVSSLASPRMWSFTLYISFCSFWC
jgi:hypothetical protein